MTLNAANQPCDSFWQSLTALRPPQACVPGSRLFERGNPAKGIYLVEEGSVNLRMQSANKSDPVFEIAGPGAILGLAESLTGEVYRLTAEAAAPTRLHFIEREAFLAFMREHPEFCMQLVRLLSENLHGLYYRFQCAAPAAARKSSA